MKREKEMDKEKTYSLRELDTLIGQIDEDASMIKVLREVRKSGRCVSSSPRYGLVTADAILAAGAKLGLTHAAWAVRNALENNRVEHDRNPPVSPPVANDDDQLTVGELRAAYKRIHPFLSVPFADSHVDVLMHDIANHREPAWAVGDVVKDDIGNWYKRTGTKQWMVFGSNGYVPDSTPRRPLEKMN